MTGSEEDIWLVVGLGNPGKEYEHTRHNAGFDVVDTVASDAGVNYWKTECGSLTGRGKLAEHDVILAKPQSFMNKSGGPVAQLMKKYGISADRMIVVHDELDLDPGTIRVKFGGGLAGHNGLKSINEKIGTRDWYRVRIGIGRPPGRKPVTDWVLTRPRGEAAEAIEHAIVIGAEAVEYLIGHGLVETQNKYN